MTDSCCFGRGANPNAKTFATNELKSLAATREAEREKFLNDNRHRIISLEKAKAVKKAKELKELKEKEIQAQSKEKKSSFSGAGYNPPPPSLHLNSYSKSDNLEDNLNPFMNSPDDEMNPFLRSESYSGSGNLFLIVFILLDFKSANEMIFFVIWDFRNIGHSLYCSHAQNFVAKKSFENLKGVTHSNKTLLS